MNSETFTISSRVGWGIVQCAVDFSSIDFSGYFICTTPFIFIFITVKEGCYNNVVDNSVVKLILPIKPWWISTISFQGHVKPINKKVVNICSFRQSAILINCHMFVWTFSFLFYSGWSEWVWLVLSWMQWGRSRVLLS